MANPQGQQSPRGEQATLRSRRKRVTTPKQNSEFVRAFADALRDILRHERRFAA